MTGLNVAHPDINVITDRPGLIHSVMQSNWITHVLIALLTQGARLVLCRSSLTAAVRSYSL